MKKMIATGALALGVLGIGGVAVNNAEVAPAPSTSTNAWAPEVKNCPPGSYKYTDLWGRVWCLR